MLTSPPLRKKNSPQKKKQKIKTNFADRAILIRVKSKRVPVPPFDHISETGQLSIPDSDFDWVIENDGTIEELYHKVDKIVEAGRIIKVKTC